MAIFRRLKPTKLDDGLKSRMKPQEGSPSDAATDEEHETESVTVRASSDESISRGVTPRNLWAYGGPKFDKNGNPIYKLPDIDVSGVHPRGLRASLGPRYRYKLKQYLLLMHLWTVQLGDECHRTQWNLQGANVFWNSQGIKTWEGRTYGWHPNWIPDAIHRLENEIAIMKGCRRTMPIKRKPVGAVSDFRMLSTARKFGPRTLKRYVFGKRATGLKKPFKKTKPAFAQIRNAENLGSGFDKPKPQ
ncbi:hypothetical protein FQN57_001238 [Myotisia sp. PD_48]|nr:hypothetical protein FQN57_001238 [Myotisia sp. PD_48]